MHPHDDTPDRFSAAYPLGSRHVSWLSFLTALAAVVFSLLAAEAHATSQGPLDPTSVWPLCGRIAENSPGGWVAADGCPAERFGNPDFTDAPISSTFGPRQLVSGNDRFDFHRGIDIPTPNGTPVFAFADGEITKAGVDAAFTDPVVQIRHFRPGAVSCAAGGGCYHSNYLHMSSVVVSATDIVQKGDLVGYSGESSISGFEHMHFEIRDAPAQDDSSAWQRDALHPLRGLAYPDSGASNISLVLDGVDDSDPLNPIVTATATIPMSVELDLERVEAEVFERQPDDSLVAVPQPGDVLVGTTIEGTGYAVEPSWYSMETWNRQYTYKDSNSIPWSSFLQNGLYESPYWAELPVGYDPNVHMDKQDQNDIHVGQFNGMSFAPIQYNDESPFYQVTFIFEALVGVADAADLCVRVRALDVRGNSTAWARHNCPVVTCADTPESYCRLGDAGKSRIGIKEKSDDKSRLRWSFSRGAVTDIADFLDPVGNPDGVYSICLYDGSGNAQPLMAMDVPPMGTCGSKPCWKATGTTGFRYKNREGTPDGVGRVKLKAGLAGRSKVKVGGRGASLVLPSIPLTEPVVAQLIIDDGSSGACWQTTFSVLDENGEGAIKAKGP